MKIIISEKEFYEIDMPSQISINQISVIADKLYKLNKIFGKDIIVNAVKVSKKNGYKTFMPKVRKKNMKLTKEQIVQLMKIMYSNETKAFKKKEFEKLGLVDYKRFAESAYYHRNLHNISPQEVGLISFPKRGETKFKLLNDRTNTNQEEEKKTAFN